MGAIRFKGETYACAEEPENDISDKEVTFETEDELEPEEPSEAPLVQSGPIKTLFKTLSTIGKNTRYLLKMMGTTDISQLGDGTLTGAIEALDNRNVKLTGDVIGTGVLDDNGDISIKSNNYYIEVSHGGVTDRKYAIFGEVLATKPFTNIRGQLQIVGGSFYNSIKGIFEFYIQTNTNNSGLNITKLEWIVAPTTVNETTIFVIYKKTDDGLLIKFASDLTDSVYNSFSIIPYIILNVSLYKEIIYLSEIPSDYTQLPSTLATIRNPVSGMAKNVTLTGNVTGSGAFDADGNASINILSRYIGNGSLNKTLWHSIFHIDSIPSGVNTKVSLKITELHPNNIDNTGILTIGIGPQAGYIALWEIANNIDTSKYMLLYKKNGTHYSIILYCKLVGGYSTVIYEPLGCIRNDVIFDNSYETGEEQLPSDYTQVESTLATIQNPVLLADKSTTSFNDIRKTGMSSIDITVSNGVYLTFISGYSTAPNQVKTHSLYLIGINNENNDINFSLISQGTTGSSLNISFSKITNGFRITFGVSGNYLASYSKIT